MSLTIRVADGDWGGAQLSDVAAVAYSAAGGFFAFDDDEAVAIVLKPTASEDTPPWTHTSPNSRGEIVVELNVRGNLWARLAYQFAHEYCHVIADPMSWPGYGDRFAWIEEALCETASLFALRTMAAEWATNPPYEVWRGYSSSLADYEAEQTGSPACALPPGLTFPTWLARHLPLLEADARRRDENTIIAKGLLPIFLADPTAWRAVRNLHTCSRSSQATLGEFMRGWAEACPPRYQSVVEAIAAAFQTAYVRAPTTTRDAVRARLATENAASLDI
jgi:hypothetical protein